MPCFQVNRIEVQFQAKHFSSLEKAAKALGWSVRKSGDSINVYNEYGGFMYSIVNGKARVTTNQQADVHKLKREYTKQGIKLGQQKFGWTTQVRGKKTALVKGGF